MKLLSILLLFGTSMTMAAQPPSDLHLPVPELETLPNGLQLVWFVNQKLPIVDLALFVKSGSADDLPGKSGTSELLVNLLDRGAGGMNAQQLARAVESLGASRYAATDEETISTGMHGLAPDAPALLELLAKIVVKPDFPEAETRREHGRLLQQWSHLADYGETLAGLTFRRIIANGTRYARGTFLSGKEFKQVTREDVVAFHKAHFTPGNAILMIVGRVDPPEFRKQVLAHFGDWQSPSRGRATNPGRSAKNPRLVIGNQIAVIDRPELNQAHVKIGFRAPKIDSPDHYSLVVANALLGEYFNSRLNSLIRDRMGLTYSIGSSFAYNKELATFSITTTTRNESVGQLIRKVLEVLRDFKNGPITEEEVATAKEYRIGGFPLTTSTLESVATQWLSAYAFGLGPKRLNEFIPRIAAVTRGDVSAAVNRHFDLDHLVITVAGDATEIEKSLAAPGNTGGMGMKARSRLPRFKVKRIPIRDLM
ncbi:MAG TPA: pitrilysin family protein [Bdellovibrionota bacterium]|nr:pitrilysin family protein [Bdellovibrionota bacterium]